MNLKRRVWLPPDGDPRLVRFQQDASWSLGLFDGVPAPPHLALSVERPRPTGPVESGDWVFTDEGAVLAAFDAVGPIGRFQLGLPPDPRDESTLRSLLPPPPRWRWTCGVTAILELRWPLGDPSFTEWSWASRRGWRADRPTL